MQYLRPHSRAALFNKLSRWFVDALTFERHAPFQPTPSPTECGVVFLTYTKGNTSVSPGLSVSKQPQPFPTMGFMHGYWLAGWDEYCLDSTWIPSLPQSAWELGRQGEAMWGCHNDRVCYCYSVFRIVSVLQSLQQFCRQSGPSSLKFLIGCSCRWNICL